MIQGLDKIQSPELQRDILQLYHELVNKAIGYNFENIPFSNIINKYVMGIDRPICICDGDTEYKTSHGGQYKVELLIDYRVTHGYKPYQSLDRPIHVFFIINKQVVRDIKLNTILNGQ